MPRPLKRSILGASKIIVSKDIHKYAFIYGSNFYESDVIRLHETASLMQVSIWYISKNKK